MYLRINKYLIYIVYSYLHFLDILLLQSEANRILDSISPQLSCR